MTRRARGLYARMADEEGVALILALAFLSLFGLWIASLLTLASTNATITTNTRTAAADEYEADGAIEQAINYVRPNLEMGRASQRVWQCGSVTDAQTSAVSTATCTGSGGVASGGTENPSNHPVRAILSLGNNGSENEIDHNASTALSVHGAVYSAGNVTNNSSPAMNVEGDLTAIGACAGTIVSVMPPNHCSDSTVVADPAYLTTVTVPRGKLPPTVCPTGGASWLLDMLPGYYDDATLLNTISTCANTVMWFEPGSFIFDFQNAGTHVWTVNFPATSQLVAGNEKGWVHTAGAKPSINFPGGCKTEFDSAPNAGVQFVFGGDSQLSLTGGKAEICSTPAAGSQQIAMYGLKTTSTTSIGPDHFYGTAVTATSGSWATTSNATGDANGTTADATAQNNNEVVTLTLGTFNQFHIPTGSTINTATVSFAHRESGSSATTLPSVTVTPGGASACAALVGTRSGAIHTDTPGGAGNATACLNTAAKVNGLAAMFSNKDGGSGSMIARLDAIMVDVTYTPQANAESGCITTTGYPSSGCAMLKTTGGSLAVQGTVYAPNAALDVTLAAVNYVVFARGVISRMFKSAIAAAGGYTGDEILIPDDCPYGVTTQNATACTTGSRTDRTVTITASIGAATKITASVTFVDGTTNPITPGGTATVAQYSANR